jgi:hypothetical protein
LRDFLCRLALAFQEPDVDAFARRITARQFLEWVRYYRRHPWGDDWNRSARLAAVTAAAGGAKIGEDFFDSFLPFADPEDEKDAETLERELVQTLKTIPQFREQLESQGK